MCCSCVRLLVNVCCLFACRCVCLFVWMFVSFSCVLLFVCMFVSLRVGLFVRLLMCVFD